MLVSRLQGSDESISEFLHVLKGLAKDCAFSDVAADVYREELTRDVFINGLASSAVRHRLLETEELSLNQATLTELIATLAACPPLVLDQSLSTMTSDSTAKNSDAVASTRRSSSTVVKAVSCFFCGLEQCFSTFFASRTTLCNKKILGNTKQNFIITIMMFSSVLALLIN